MIAIITDNVPPKLRGRLALWLLEVRAGVYVGVQSKRTRDRLWEECCDYAEGGSIVMCWSTNTESGFDFKTFGPNRRIPSDHDGLRLVRFLPLRTDQNGQQQLDLNNEPWEIELKLDIQSALPTSESGGEEEDEEKWQRYLEEDSGLQGT